MIITPKVKEILSAYEGDNPGTKTNLSRILMHGKLGGSGKMIILPVDQGFEHGPAASFSKNQQAYDPCYHYELAIEAGLSAYAAPLGMLETGADKYAGAIPTVLKLNSANSLTSSKNQPHQSITASVNDALRLGCVGVGFTIYPGSDFAHEMIEQLKEIIYKAKELGLIVMVWSYPRGGDLTKDDETSLDVLAYASHIAALLGAHIIKVKLPTSSIYSKNATSCYLTQDYSNLSVRVGHIKQSCFAGKRLVVFSGGLSKNEDELYQDIKAIKAGAGDGSIIGRNSFQRSKEDALKMLNNVIDIYLNQ